jgi:SNF2 family DNA or RNA helicase
MVRRWLFLTSRVNSTSNSNASSPVTRAHLSDKKLFLNLFPISSPKHPNLIITTYGLVSSATRDYVHDSHFWDYVVLDEAHLIKNPTTTMSKTCRRVCRHDVTRRIVLTGTPIMNHLRELWALVDFATSGKVLGTQTR